MIKAPDAYAAAFEAESGRDYPVIAAFEARMGYAIGRERLEAAARVLACPIKKNPPNWQHGRVIYALGRARLAQEGGYHYWLDIGTAKGFSAVCMALALDDALREGKVLSLDIIDPYSREPRNSVEDGKDVFGFTRDFIPMGSDVTFMKGSARDILRKDDYPSRLQFAFVDGSHRHEGVQADISAIAERQIVGDVILFDDIQIKDVAKAIAEINGYAFEDLWPLPTRGYRIAVKQ